MAVNPITEKPSLSRLAEDAQILITQTVLEDGQEKTAIRRATLQTVSDEMARKNNRAPYLENAGANSDLDVADREGNVLARFVGGHIQTKNFDSGEAVAAMQAAARAEFVSDSSADLDLTDQSGNVLARFAEGHFQTKRFDSRKMQRIEKTYTVSGSGTGITLSVAVDLKKGDKIVLETDDGIGGWRWGNHITYKAGSKTIADNIQGSNMFFPYTLDADCSEISVTFGQADYTQSETKTLTVYKLGLLPITPTVVTVKKDGTGDFSTIRAAVDYVDSQSPSAELNPYEIHVYPGRYDVLDDYTADEINYGNSGAYDNTSFSGVKLCHGVSMIGVGLRDDVILYGELDTDTFPLQTRKNVSTLNLQGTGNIENITVISKNLRYCVHDDFGSPDARVNYRRVINCKFIGSDFSNDADTTYGAGMNAPRFMYFRDCDFGRTCGIHTMYNSRGMWCGVEIVFDHCKGNELSIGDRVHASANPVHTFVLNSCDFRFISIARGSGDVDEQHCRVTGTGCEDTMFFGGLTDKYSYGTVVLMPPAIAKGKAVDMSGAVVSGPDTAYGVCIGVDDDNSYIQYRGYINSNLLGISSPSVGDFITVNASGEIVSGTAANAIGKCVYVRSGVGQYKLNLIGG